MEAASETMAARPLAKRRRAIKACASCRHSKVKCDGERPCGRCATINAECVYQEAPTDPTTEFERLESEIGFLRGRMQTLYSLLPTPLTSNERAASASYHLQPYSDASTAMRQVMGGQSIPTPRMFPPISSSNTHEGPLSTPDEGSAAHTGYNLSSMDDLSAHNGSAIYTPTPAQTLPRASAEGSSRKRKRGAFMVQTQVLPDLVARGVLSEVEAKSWFRSFFTGSHRLVPVFCLQFDTMPSVRSRSSFLFDAIISVGCRAENGPGSQSYQKLQPFLREHLSNFLLQPTAPGSKSVETLQALLVMASYSDSGWVIVSIALHLALDLDLPEAVGQLMARMIDASVEKYVNGVDEEEKRLFRFTRTWYGVLNLDHIFSLDGGKNLAVTPLGSPRRLRVLLSHPQRTPVDLRLFAQVELNAMRSLMLDSVLRVSEFSLAAEEEAELASAICGARIDLDLWLEEWTSIVQKHSQEPDSDTEVTLLNLQIQHEWALITLHLKAISMMGVENLALMTDPQRDIILAAKEAAERHLELLLHASSANEGNFSSPASERAYLTSFKWTMDFVWAKCAFSVLLVLRLSMLLQDPPERLMRLLHQAHELLEELERGTGGQIAYFQILTVSVEKCEKALREYTRHQQQQQQYEVGSGVTVFAATPGNVGSEQNNSSAGTLGENDAEQDFQAYAPRELLQQWSFPGLNLRHVPIGWQDLFMDFDTMF